MSNPVPADVAPVVPTRVGVSVWIGRVLTVLIIAALTMSAVMKLTKAAPLVEGFTKFGYPVELAFGIGVLELVCVLIYAIPQTSVLGAILLTGYLGGAIATHVRVNDDYIAVVVMAVVMWLALALREKRIWALVPFRR